MSAVELAKSLQHKMFADRETIDQAYDYAHMVARGTDNPMAVMAAVQVVVNTICKAIIEEDLKEKELS